MKEYGGQWDDFLSSSSVCCEQNIIPGYC